MTKKKKQKRIGIFGYAGEKEICPICNKKRQRFHKHHITYSPVKEVRLCSWCHEKITQLNTFFGKIGYTKLTSAERIEIWDAFIKTPRLSAIKIFKSILRKYKKV